MKNLYLIITMLFVSLLTSCSKEEGMNSGETSDKVSVFAKFAEDAVATRAQIDIAATHKLRCIIEIWTTEISPSLVHREEVAVEAGNIPPFEFELKAGDYNCLMWADFIERGAESTQVTSGGVSYEHFAEIYYNTSNLNNVTIKNERGENLFDTDLCDAFFAHLELKKEEKGISRELKLARPFSKLIVKEKDIEKFSELKKMEVTYNVPAGFNVSTGEPIAETMNTVYEKNFEVGDDSKVLFTNYIFAPSSPDGKALETMILSFTAKGKADCEVASGSIIIRRNEKVNASGNLITEGKVDPDPEPEPGEEPKVGDYFFIDGTWGTELTVANKSKCIGIVFAIGAKEGDHIGAYGEKGTGKQILGYVMSLKNVKIPEGMIPSDGNLGDYQNGDRPYFYKQKEKALDPNITIFPKPDPASDWLTYNGFSITGELMATELFANNGLHYPALQSLKLWSEEMGYVENTSGWYFPSAAQLLECIGRYFGYEGKSEANPSVPAISKDYSFSTAFDKAIAEKIAITFSNGTTTERNLMSVSLSKEAAPLSLQVKGSEIIIPNFTWKLQGYVRPVLTILK